MDSHMDKMVVDKMVDKMVDMMVDTMVDKMVDKMVDRTVDRAVIALLRHYFLNHLRSLMLCLNSLLARQNIVAQNI
jgi:hypothetical protein